jgi:hypothetical protein
MHDCAFHRDYGDVSGQKTHSRLLDNAKYHQAQMGAGMAGTARLPLQTSLHSSLLPAPEPHRRLWGLMHKNVTHNRCYSKFNGFCGAMLTFLRIVRQLNFVFAQIAPLRHVNA